MGFRKIKHGRMEDLVDENFHLKFFVQDSLPCPRMVSIGFRCFVQFDDWGGVLRISRVNSTPWDMFRRQTIKYDDFLGGPQTTVQDQLKALYQNHHMQKIGTKQKSEIFQIFWIDNQDDLFPFNDEENVEIALRYSKSFGNDLKLLFIAI